MKRVKLTWADGAQETIVIGTAREIRSLYKNLRKRFWSIYSDCSYYIRSQYGMYGVSIEDQCILTGNDVTRWMYDAQKVEVI